MKDVTGQQPGIFLNFTFLLIRTGVVVIKIL
jgi:hypothetical protein